MGTGLRRDAAGAAGRRRAVRAADLAPRVHGGAGVAVRGDYPRAPASPEGGGATPPPPPRGSRARPPPLFSQTPKHRREPGARAGGGGRLLGAPPPPAR